MFQGIQDIQFSLLKVNSHFTILSSFIFLVLELLSVSKMKRRVLFCFLVGFWWSTAYLLSSMYYACPYFFCWSIHVNQFPSSNQPWTFGVLLSSTASPFQDCKSTVSLRAKLHLSLWETEILLVLSSPCQGYKEWEFVKVALSSPHPAASATPRWKPNVGSRIWLKRHQCGKLTCESSGWERKLRFCGKHDQLFNKGSCAQGKERRKICMTNLLVNMLKIDFLANTLIYLSMTLYLCNVISKMWVVCLALLMATKSKIWRFIGIAP